MAFDIAWGGAAMDLMSPEGFIGAIYHACRLKPGTGCLAAPVCSSFVYMFFSSFSKCSLFEEWWGVAIMFLGFKEYPTMLNLKLQKFSLDLPFVGTSATKGFQGGWVFINIYVSI